MLLYPIVLFLHLPWLLLFGTAAFRIAAGHSGRLYRLEIEGAAMALVGTFAKWIVYDPNFGFALHDISRWGEWFDRGERGLFWIGVLLFALGYVLERRPRPGLVHWPSPAPTLGWSALLAGIALGTAIWAFGWFSECSLPWAPGRVAFTIGCLPFAVGYSLYDRRVHHLTEAE